MIIFVTGAPGAGKTLYALHLMREEYRRNLAASQLPETDPKHQKKRQFFTNVDGCNFDWLSPWPEDDDWRNLPDGSYLLYDEAHQDHLFPQKGASGARAADPRIRDMDEHRHRGFDMVMVTQWPAKVHWEIRTLSNKHYHCARGTGAQACVVIEWGSVKPNPNSKTVQKDGDEEIWRYPKDLFDSYRSSTVHTSSYKFRIPAKFVTVLTRIAILPIILWLLWKFVFSPNVDAKEKDATAVEATAGAPAADALPPGYEAVQPDGTPLKPQDDRPADSSDQAKPYPVACISTSTRCRCYQQDGWRMDITTEQCNVYLKDGLPRIAVGGSSSLQPSASVVAAPATSSPAVSSRVPDVQVQMGEGVGNGRIVESKLPAIGGI